VLFGCSFVHVSQIKLILSYICTLLGDPVELDERFFACLVKQPEGVHAEPRHVSVGFGDADIIQQEGQLRERKDRVSYS